jgi:unsaturated chondroitin disaccharide hydrolase
MDQHSLFTQALDFAASQCRNLIAAHPGYTPMYTVGGKWAREGERWTNWCEGFYPGIFWLLHKTTGEAFWREQAEAYSRPLAPRRFDRAVHDLGFLFFSTYLRWYRLTAEPDLRGVLIQAGRTLALRRQVGGYLASFLGPESLFIDIMMNVGLIFWAAKETGDETLRQIAIEHCRTSMRTLLRPDGSTAHEAIFDPATGQFLRQSTQQGYGPESTWSRGLAWAIYGFAACHRLGGPPELLDVAQKCADCYLRRAPDNLVPPWDLSAPDDGHRPLDSSAAAIAASAFFDLSEQVEFVYAQKRFRLAALKILESLCGETFLAKSRPGWEGILLHGVYHLPKNLGVYESVSWGDYFFVEALVKAVG